MRLAAMLLLAGGMAFVQPAAAQQAAQQAAKSERIVYIGGAKYYVHTVRPGETRYGLARLYEVSDEVLVANNPSVAEGLKAGETLRIPVVAATVRSDSASRTAERKQRKNFLTHKVSAGETLYAISRRYEVPVQSIIADNPALDPIRLHPGDEVLIRKKERGSEDEQGSLAGWEDYRQSLNSVADEGYGYHLVAPGETFYSLARRFDITEEELGALNGGLKPAELKAGAIIRIPDPDGTIARGDEAAPESEVPEAEADSVPPAARHKVDFRPLGGRERLGIALLLPTGSEGKPNTNYLEFYQGFLLGLDSVKQRLGYSADVVLYNTERSPERVEELAASEALAHAQLIVGPVYEEVLHPVIRHAEAHGIPVVSPLAHVGKLSSDALFQLAPDPAWKYAKAADLVDGSRRVTLIYSEHTDKEFEHEMREMLARAGCTYATHTYKYVHPSAARGTSSPSNLTPLLENDDDNLFIILSDNETEVDRILAALASADTNITSRGRKAPRFSVLGNTRWNRYNNIDRTIFFKTRVIFFSTYHAKRDAAAVRDFDSAYIRAFGALPTLYAYRGYDAAMIFVPAMFNDIQYDMEGRTYTPLQTTYLFGRGGSQIEDAPNRNHVNRNWMRVDYHNDFTITVQ